MSAAGGGNFLQQIQAAKAEKAQTIEQLKVLDEKVAEQHHKVYSSLLGINAEIANKFFKESTSDISFSARISSAVALMVGYNTTERFLLTSVLTTLSLPVAPIFVRKMKRSDWSWGWICQKWLTLISV